MEIFLKLKPWQIFMLICGMPFIAMFVLMSLTTNADLIFKVFPIFMLVFISIFLLWFWSLGTILNSYVSENIRPSSRFFKFSIIYSVLYITLFQIVFMFPTNAESNISIIRFIGPFHFLSMACMFYGLYFVAKNLKLAETQQPATFGSFAGFFFLIWFYPIGIWFVQSKVNSVYAAHHST